MDCRSCDRKDRFFDPKGSSVDPAARGRKAGAQAEAWKLGQARAKKVLDVN